jgi:hypothetical protein
MVKNIKKIVWLPLKPHQNGSSSGRLVTATIQNFEFKFKKIQKILKIDQVDTNLMVSKKFQIFVRLVYFAGIRRSTIFG